MTLLMATQVMAMDITDEEKQLLRSPRAMTIKRQLPRFDALPKEEADAALLRILKMMSNLPTKDNSEKSQPALNGGHPNFAPDTTAAE